ncbi:MAG TPA: FlgD immunoglobulin-like domain containing protein, partial [Candidatus Deferrimicrobium sp.]|nr:FlgD immunoglobulin-like domain containing protein [Candidatus Deferrimicrobium sp.]
SSLEQMYNISDAITEANQIDLLQMQSLNNAMAAGLIGKDIKAAFAEIHLDEGATPQLSFTTSAYAAEVRLRVLDSSGSVVATLTAENLPAGVHSITWDGKDNLGNTVPEGEYAIEALATDPSGKTFKPELAVAGTVDAVIYRDGIAYLRVDGVEIPLGDVTAIGERGSFSES